MCVEPAGCKTCSSSGVKPGTSPSTCSMCNGTGQLIQVRALRSMWQQGAQMCSGLADPSVMSPRRANTLLLLCLFLSQPCWLSVCSSTATAVRYTDGSMTVDSISSFSPGASVVLHVWRHILHVLPTIVVCVLAAGCAHTPGRLPASDCVPAL